MRQVREAALGLVVILTGCDAHFTDLRPEALDGEPRDAGFLDVGPPPSTATPILAGTFQGRGRYRAGGGVELVQQTDGSFELVFLEDFAVSSVPGPVIVLSTRTALGHRIQAGQGDLDLGVLDDSAGMQSYPAPAESVNAKYAWIFCRPYGVEIGRAELSEVSQ